MPVTKTQQNTDTKQINFLNVTEQLHNVLLHAYLKISHVSWCPLDWDLGFQGDTVHHTRYFYH